MNEVSRSSAEKLASYKESILATKPLMQVLHSSEGAQQTNVLAHMHILTTHGGMSEKEYLALLTSCQQTGNFGPMLEAYAKVNNQVLAQVLRDASLDVRSRNAASNTLGMIEGALEAYQEQGTVTVDHIGTPPNFQTPDWLFAAERWLEANGDSTMEDLYAALEGESSAKADDPILLMQGNATHDDIEDLLQE